MAIKIRKGKLDKSKFLTNLVNHDKLTPHLERATQEEFEWEYSYKGKVKDDAFHPSGHCIPNVSELYHLATTTEEDRKLKSMQKVFQLGHFWHQYLQQLVLRNGLATKDAVERTGYKWWGNPQAEWAKEDIYYNRIDGLDTEDPAVMEVLRRLPQELSHARVVQPQPYHWVTGSADVAPCRIPHIGDFAVDFKTMGNHDFKQAGLPSWCAGKYEAQINIYMDFFDLERALIITVQKDTPHDFKEFEFIRNQPLIDTIYQKWEAVSHVLDYEYTSDTERNLELKELDGEFEDLPIAGPIEKS